MSITGWCPALHWDSCYETGSSSMSRRCRQALAAQVRVLLGAPRTVNVLCTSCNVSCWQHVVWERHSMRMRQYPFQVTCMFQLVHHSSHLNLNMQCPAGQQAPSSSRTPQPGYVLLIMCPAASCQTSRQPGSTSLVADFSSSMGTLCEVLQAALGPHWGSLPSLWRKAAAAGTAQQAAGATATAALAPQAAKAAGVARPAGFRAGSNGGGSGGWRAAMVSSGGHVGKSGESAEGVVAPPAGGNTPWATSFMPAHGLQMASQTRSLATLQVSS
jgi:hypothetical protein